MEGLNGCLCKMSGVAIVSMRSQQLWRMGESSSGGGGEWKH